MQTTATPKAKTTETLLLLPVSGRFHVRPVGQREYGELASGGLFELVWLNDAGLPYPCGRVLSRNALGILEVRAANGMLRLYGPDMTREELNDIADAARRKLIAQGW